MGGTQVVETCFNVLMRLRVTLADACIPEEKVLSFQIDKYNPERRIVLSGDVKTDKIKGARIFIPSNDCTTFAGRLEIDCGTFLFVQHVTHLVYQANRKYYDKFL